MLAGLGVGVLTGVPVTSFVLALLLLVGLLDLASPLPVYVQPAERRHDRVILGRDVPHLGLQQLRPATAQGPAGDKKPGR